MVGGFSETIFVFLHIWVHSTYALSAHLGMATVTKPFLVNTNHKTVIIYKIGLNLPPIKVAVFSMLIYNFLLLVYFVHKRKTLLKEWNFRFYNSKLVFLPNYSKQCVQNFAMKQKYLQDSWNKIKFFTLKYFYFPNLIGMFTT